MGLSEQTDFVVPPGAQNQFAPERPHDFSNRYRESRTAWPFRDNHLRPTLTPYPAAFFEPLIPPGHAGRSMGRRRAAQATPVIGNVRSRESNAVHPKSASQQIASGATKTSVAP